MRTGAKQKLAAGAAILLAMPVLSDFVQWSLWRQALQRQADSAALAGAYRLRIGEPAIPAIRSLVATWHLADPPVIELPPRNGPYARRPNAVRVSLTATRAPFFHSLLFGPSRMRARATAAVVSYRSGITRAVRVE